MSENHTHGQSASRFEGHFPDRRVFVHVDQLFFELAGHLVPHVDEPHLYDLEFFPPRVQKLLPLALMLG